MGNLRAGTGWTYDISVIWDRGTTYHLTTEPLHELNNTNTSRQVAADSNFPAKNLSPWKRAQPSQPPPSSHLSGFLGPPTPTKRVHHRAEGLSPTHSHQLQWQGRWNEWVGIWGIRTLWVWTRYGNNSETPENRKPPYILIMDVHMSGTSNTWKVCQSLWIALLTFLVRLFTRHSFESCPF